MEKSDGKATGMIHRIAVIGPESTGKSSLCRALAGFYQTVWVPEYSREYIAALTRPYSLNDIELIAKSQLAMEAEAMRKANRFLFADTELIIASVWCIDSFKTAPPWMELKIMEMKYDYYLITAPDLPWIKDPVRENGHRRDFFFNWYKKELDNRNFPYTVIEGSGDERLNKAIYVIEKHFGK